AFVPGQQFPGFQRPPLRRTRAQPQLLPAPRARHALRPDDLPVRVPRHRVPELAGREVAVVATLGLLAAGTRHDPALGWKPATYTSARSSAAVERPGRRERMPQM